MADEQQVIAQVIALCRKVEGIGAAAVPVEALLAITGRGDDGDPLDPAIREVGPGAALARALRWARQAEQAIAGEQRAADAAVSLAWAKIGRMMQEGDGS